MRIFSIAVFASGAGSNFIRLYDYFSKIDEILKSNDGRIVKGRGSKEANKVKYKINNIRISRTGRLVEMFKSLRKSC